MSLWEEVFSRLGLALAVVVLLYLCGGVREAGQECGEPGEPNGLAPLARSSHEQVTVWCIVGDGKLLSGIGTSTSERQASVLQEMGH